MRESAGRLEMDLKDLPSVAQTRMSPCGSVYRKVLLPSGRRVTLRYSDHPPFSTKPVPAGSGITLWVDRSITVEMVEAELDRCDAEDRARSEREEAERKLAEECWTLCCRVAEAAIQAGSSRTQAAKRENECRTICNMNERLNFLLWVLAK